MAAHQAPLSLGFSRQEYWTGLPFPSLMHENEKWKWSCSVVSNSLRPHGLQPTRLLHPWDFPVKNTGVGCHSLLQGIFLSQEIEPGSPTLQADSLLSESLRKPFQENTCLYCMLIPPMSLLLLQRFDEHFLHRNLLLWIVRSEKLIFWLVSCHPYFWKHLCLSVIQQETEVHQEDYKKYQS